MTTPRTPFVPFRTASLPQPGGARPTRHHRLTAGRALILSLSLGLGSIAAASPTAGQDTTQTGPGTAAPKGNRIVQLPVEADSAPIGPREIIDGHHLYWVGDEPEPSSATLGPVVPSRTLVSVIERRVDQEGGREAGVSVENLGSVLLIRGGVGTSPEALDRAEAAANRTVAEFSALADSLRFDTRISLTATGDGVEPISVLQAERTLIAGTRTGFGTRITRSMCPDFDVEVAMSTAIADPVIAKVETGETLHLWASTVIAPNGSRQLYVQGLLDIAVEKDSRSFHPDVYELGVLEQPTVTTYQVMFAGTVPAMGPLVVTLDGIAGERSVRRLEISAGEDGRAEGAVGAERIVDLSRGMWRGSLHEPHALHGMDLPLNIPESRMPASAAQLMALAFGRERLPRPDLGSTALFLSADEAERNRTVQALFESIDPTGPTRTVHVNFGESGFQAWLPATLGAPLRVARTEETILVVDYNPQVANEAHLSDPDSEIFLTGQVLEGVLEPSGESVQLRCVSHARTLTDIRVRDVDPVDVGRIQHATTQESAAVVSVKPGAPTAAAGLTITLK